jgi:hypothetical protein
MAEPWQVVNHATPTARVPHRCEECGRTIQIGERYCQVKGRLEDSGWVTNRWCRHCDAAAEWLNVVCHGYIIGRLIAGLRLRWHDGADPVPEGVSALAVAMMRQQVAS